MSAPETKESDLIAVKTEFDATLRRILALAKERLSEEPIVKLEQLRADVMPIITVAQSILQDNEVISENIKGINRQEMSESKGQKTVYLADWDSNDGMHHSLQFVVESASPTGKIVLESYVPRQNESQYRKSHNDANIPEENKIEFAKLTPLKDLILAKSEIELDEKTVATQDNYKEVFLKDEFHRDFLMPHSSPDLSGWADHSLLLALHEADFNFGPRSSGLEKPAGNPLDAVKKATKELAYALGQYDYLDENKSEEAKTVDS